jgi:hypothetical protein
MYAASTYSPVSPAYGGAASHLPSGADAAKDKRGVVSCVPTRDGRVHVSLQVAATLTRNKIYFLGAALFCAAVYLMRTSIGLGGTRAEEALRLRVASLESAMSRKISWLSEHASHLNTHLSGGMKAWAPRVHEDGRNHLLSDPDGPSKLATFVAPDTVLPPVDDHYLCGENAGVSEAEVVRKKLALVCVTWMAPLSLRNSLETWKKGGLLDLVDEKMMFINSPQPVDYALAKEYDFDVYTTEEHNGNIMAGPALSYLVGNASADYVLFMEKDFELNSDKPTTARELYLGMHMLARGVDVWRLRGTTDYPAEGMPDCCAPATPPNCPYHSNWKSGGYFSDHQNWLLAYCQPNPVEAANGRLVQCTKEPAAPDSYCFGSGDTNWSNNPLLMSTKWYKDRIWDVAMNGEKAWDQNNMFEFNVMMHWLSFRPPAKVCM